MNFLRQLSFHKSTYPAPHSNTFSILRWTDHLLQKSSKSTLPHSTVHNAVVILQSYLFTSFFPFESSLSFKLGQGSFALLGQQGNRFFSLRETFTFTIYTWQGHCTKTGQINLNSNSRFSLFPDYQLLPRAYEIVPCCTFTIHKGYYIVFAFFPFSRLSYATTSPPFSPSE